MKRFLILLMIFMSALSQTASAELGNQGLIINGGVSEIKLEAGEKKQIWVRDGLTGLPAGSGVTFYSDNDLIATVGEDSGILHGISGGTAHITVMSAAGRSARIKVVVKNGSKAPPLLLLIPLGLGAGIFLFTRRRKR